MRPYSFLGIFILAVLILASCTFQRYPYPATDLTKECWQYSVQSTPQSWKKGADAWFLRAEPSVTEIRNRFSVTETAMSTMHVKVANFDRIKVSGKFQVQIFGTDEDNSVDLYGPNKDVRNIAIELNGGLLTLTQVIPAPDMERVIVRIGIRKLHELVQNGCSKIEGIAINSDHLTVTSNPGGDGNIYLTGKIVLKRVVQYGAGTISFFNVSATGLTIYTAGLGTVNVHGRVGVRSITHLYGGDINIIGGYNDCLKIYAEGTGKIGICGEVNLREVIARGNTKVYVSLVNSRKLSAMLAGNAIVGVAGKTDELKVTTTDEANFQGRFLEARKAEISASYRSHINVTAREDVFARADGIATIYYFGPPERLAPFTKGKASIIPIGYDAIYHPQPKWIVSKTNVINVKAKS